MLGKCLAALLYLGVMQGELAHDPLVRAASWELLVDAEFGFSQNEEAMFVVRGDDGALRFIRWPKSNALRRAEWNAPVPPGALAIVHTHPNPSPYPSMADIRTAMRSNLPVYVLTRTKITKATTDGELLLVANGEWRSGAAG